MTRIRALLMKELMDVRQNPGVFLPAIIAGGAAIILPFVIAIIVPSFTGERLSESGDFQVAIDMYRQQPDALSLDAEGAIQAWLFQHFLLLLVVLPITGSTSVAAHSVIGEKQSRTLEPLLATPITTFELLTAKVLGALIPGLLATAACYVCYVVAVAWLARPGVFWMLLTSRSLAIVFLLGPLATLAALQLAVCVSSRVNDPRTAQQIGALVVLPIAGLLMIQLTGMLLVRAPLLPVFTAALVVLNAVLMRIGIVLFARESILTRWR